MYADNILFLRLISILISRFLINLQAVNRKSTGMVSSTGSRVESAVFQRVIGSLGGNAGFGGNIDPDEFELSRVDDILESTAPCTEHSHRNGIPRNEESAVKGRGSEE